MTAVTDRDTETRPAAQPAAKPVRRTRWRRWVLMAALPLLVAVGGGTLLGAALGNAAGASLDRADQNYAQQAAVNAYSAPTGSTVRWNNPDTGNYGSYTPVREGTGPQGQLCREYQTTIVVQGRTQQGFGTACQQPDGTWRVVS